MLEVLVFTHSLDDVATLAKKVRSWEEMGLNGVVIPDHFFGSQDGRRTTDAVQPDPFVILPAIGAMSSSLRLGTMVANCNLVHPAWVLRHLSQLALLYGGNRVIAGLGAGWSSEEFDALGMTMPLHAQRTRRLEEALELARQFFTGEPASVVGESFAVRELPTLTGRDGAPRILVGGGSERLLELAARYADHVDLNGWPGGKKLGRSGTPRHDGLRRLTTTVDDLSASVGRLNELLDEAGREPGSLRHSVLLDTIDVCAAKEVVTRRAQLAQARGGDESWVDSCPYVLVGPVTNMAEALAQRIERLDLSTLIVLEGPHLEVFMREVLPLVGAA